MQPVSCRDPLLVPDLMVSKPADRQGRPVSRLPDPVPPPALLMSRQVDCEGRHACVWVACELVAGP